ncbi:ABC-2 type transport system ATP-binding protein [Cryobacterium flavum]|uniref:ABC-2 type transport system ATP-binding protein n=1 Tax=Cryobacterium flavum TaxID=1424659 RepID=A0A4R8UVM6_9MICO|nr:ATP-binding cassette domain-containing protein [Cryobacterium flavum]TFB72507.1 ATP-binding cassette domain-containing protein [Cryobacterium flavum]SDM96646.1 ABC-2 type transport system ATP-binding protein [Cryobacterium flavum]
MINAEHLTKRYGSRLAVDDVSFNCRPGRVTGFLGPNGAGKSTVMRMLCALTAPSTGRSLVLGHPFRELRNPGHQVGVLLDASAQHGGRTGREMLSVSAQLMRLPAGRVRQIVDHVGLTAREADARTRTYSLGMRQRLGLAHALLGDPQVLILDEPANGLDPAGIRWMRGLLRSFADAGGTVLLSSHLLHEVEAMADDLVIIGNGRILAQGSADQLLAVPGTRVQSLDNDGLLAELIAAGHAADATSDGVSTGASVVDVGRIALAGGIVLIDLRPAEAFGLEELFFDMTAQHGRDEVAA